MNRFLSFLILFCVLTADSFAQIQNIEKEFQQLGYPYYQGNHVVLLPTGKVKFDHLLEEISHAKHNIYIEYYKFWNDSIGRKVLDALAERVQNGVNVRLVYDAFGNSGKAPGCTPEFLRHYQNLGIDIIGFDPMRFPYINHALHRLHRKMVVIDGKVLYTGGMNVADYYIHGKPEIGNWCDMHAYIQGPIVNGYQELFRNMWYRLTRERLDTISFAHPVPDGYPAYLVDREPGRKSSNIRDSYVACLNNAQKSVRIVNPYVILTHSVRKGLRDALKRGLHIEFLVSLKGDNILSETNTARELHNLMKRGAEVWLYQGGFHHDKVMVVDDTLCTIGTANLDPRSLCFDYEVNAFFVSPELSEQLIQYIENEKKSSVLLTEDNWKTLYSRKQRRIGWWTKGIRGIL